MYFFLNTVFFVCLFACGSIAPCSLSSRRAGDWFSLGSTAFRLFLLVVVLLCFLFLLAFGDFQAVLAFCSLQC